MKAKKYITPTCEIINSDVEGAILVTLSIGDPVSSDDARSKQCFPLFDDSGEDDNE